jgi:hypothetical protein
LIQGIKGVGVQLSIVNVDAVIILDIQRQIDKAERIYQAA